MLCKMRAAALLWFCTCVGTQQLNEWPVSNFPETSAQTLQRREAPQVQNSSNQNSTSVLNVTDLSSSVAANATANATVNASKAEAPDKKIDLSKPGVLKRAFLVFGGFGLLAFAYFVFYRRRHNKGDAEKTSHPSDGPQFRYGVLQTEEGSDRMELSHMPLTMDSDEDEDDDLEIFDLGQKKKSLSYVNLHTEDNQSVVDDILSSKTNGRDSEQLLLDIEDRNSAAVLPLTSTKTSTDII